MKLAVVGSRDFNDYAWLEQCLSSVVRDENIEAVVSGGARGADALAERFAEAHDIPLIVVPADWKKFGRSAGPRRNTEIVRLADVVVAFWDGSSRGTRDTLTQARQFGRRVMIFPCRSAQATGVSPACGHSRTGSSSESTSKKG